MLKRILTVLLCIFILLPHFASCGQNPSGEKDSGVKPGTSASTSSPSFSPEGYLQLEEHPTDIFFDYYSIASLYGSIARLLIRGKRYNETCTDEILAIYGDRTRNADERSWLTYLSVSAWLLFPGRYQEHGELSDYVNACGYAIKDLNGDGIDELLLMNFDYTIVALFSTVDGHPRLVSRFSDSYRCAIDGDGLIHVSASYTAGAHNTSVYRLSPGGAELQHLYEFGHDEIPKEPENENDTTVSRVAYRTENGERTYISDEEYDSLEEQYRLYLGGLAENDVTKNLSGLKYTPVFKPLYTYGSYEEILATLRKITSLYNVYKLEPSLKGTYDWYFDLSTEENRKFYEKLNELVQYNYPPALGASSPDENAFAYGIKDLNGDGTDELILIEGDMFASFAILTKKNGRIVFDDSYSLVPPYGSMYHHLCYWINTVGLDLKPLFPESYYFDLDAYRREEMVTFDKMLSGDPYYSLWLVAEERFVDLDEYLSTLPYAPIGYAFVDMDGDTIDELVIKFVDRFIVISTNLYTYTLTCDAIYTDGSFSWHSQDSTVEYGSSRFQGYISLKSPAELWKVVNDGEPDARYYVEGKQVSFDELTSYLTDSSPKTEVEFVDRDRLWGDRLSPLEAYEIAKDYWKELLDELNSNYRDKYDRDDDGYQCQFCYHSIFYQNSMPSKVPENVYMFRLCTTSGAWKSLSEIWIDATTGNVYPPYSVNTDGQVVAEGSISCNGNDSTGITYKITQRGEVTLHIEDWNEDHLISAVSLSSDTEIERFRCIEKAIAINNKHACLFLRESGRKINVVRFEKGSATETVTSIEMSENVIGIKGNFINENIGYLFAFKEVSEGHANGGAKLSNLFITEDGGNTWNLIDVQNVPSISLREYIIYSKMTSEDVGLISGNFFAADYDFCDRTLLTTDGGLNWFNVENLPQINELLWAIVTDFEQVGDSYVLTIRYTASESTGEYGYAEYKLINSNTWIRIS